MVRQQTQCRGARSRQANSVTQHGDGAENVLRDFDEHRKALEYLAGALDFSMVESKHSAVVRIRGDHISAASLFSCGPQDHIIRNSQRFHWLLDDAHALRLYTHAAVNSMDVVLQGVEGCLLDHSKATGIVGSLCNSISSCMELKRGKGSHVQQELHLQLTRLGLVPALSRFTAATWQAVQQLDTSNSRHQPQQQQQQLWRGDGSDYEARQGTASTLIAELLELWRAVLLHTLACPRPDMSVEPSLPALIGLTASLYPILKRTRASIDSRSSSLSIPLAACDAALSRAATTSLTLADYIVLQDWNNPLQLQDIYLTEKLPELLLQLLADQAGQLHTACGGMSQALQDRHAATANQTQQQDRPVPFAGCMVPNSHLALLQYLGLDDHISPLGVKTHNTQDLMRRFIPILNTVCSAVLARLSRKAQLESSSSSYRTLDAGQQQLEHTYSVLPSHLSVPTVKMLIELVLLAPSDNLAVHACSLKFILLLLHVAATPRPAAATAAAVGCQQGPEVSALCPWPQLPAALAAGLLRLVVAQLPQAVMYCLVQTDQQQEHQMKNNRLMLLHSYGSLLISVCQPVESKHIAAALKSQSAADLLVSLAAIEAVIRAQACHLAPQSWKEEQQLQQQADPHETTPGGGSSTSSRLPVRDILQHPQGGAPVLLLPFAAKIAEALLELVQQPLQQQDWLAPSDSTDAKFLLCVRLFTLMITILTLCQAATAAVAGGGIGAATKPATNIGQHPAGRSVVEFASGVAHDISRVAYTWWYAVNEGTPSEARDALPAVVLLRAMSICSCGVSQLLQTLPSQQLSGATNAVEVAPTLLPALGSVTLVINVLRVFAPAAAHVDVAAPSSTEAQEQVATAAEPVGSRQLQPACDRSPPGAPWLVDDVVSCCLAKLLQQWQDLKSALESALQLGIDSMGTNPSVSSISRTQGPRSAGELKHFADALHHLCEASLAAFSPRYCCSNPVCTNLTKLSEWQLVSGNSCVCAGCGMAKYCSTSCQSQHWSLHKPVCSKHTLSSHDAA